MKNLSLIPGAFNDELFRFTGSGKTRYGGEEHEQFVDTLLSRLVDGDNQAAVLADELKDKLKLIFRPTDARQRRAMAGMFAEAGYELDGSAVEAFALLFNVSQFSTYLTAKDPETQTSLITKPKRIGKKNTLKALLKQKPVVSNPEPATPAPVSDENPDADGDEADPAPVQPVLAASKKSAASK